MMKIYLNTISRSNSATSAKHKNTGCDSCKNRKQIVNLQQQIAAKAGN